MAQELTPEEQAILDRKANAAQEAWEAYWSPSTLFPLHTHERLFSTTDFFFLGLAAAAPLTMLSLQTGGALSPAANFAAAVVAIILATLVLWPLAKLSQSYGLGSAIISAGLLGQHGARILGVGRALFGALFFAETTVTMALLLQGLLAARFPNSTLLPFTLGRWPLSLNTLLLLGLLLAGQFWLLKGGIKRLAACLKKTTFFYLGGLLLLLIWLLVSYKPQAVPALSATVTTTFPTFMAAVTGALLILAPLVFSSPDYFRYAQQKSSPAPFVMGAGLLTGQTLLFILQLAGQRYLPFGIANTPLNWLTASYQPLISWLAVLLLLSGCLLANLLLNGYPATMAAVLLKPVLGPRPWQIALVASALPLYWLMTCFYQSGHWLGFLKSGALVFWLAALMMSFYFGIIKKFRFNLNSLYYKPPKILYGFKVLTIGVLLLSSLLGSLLLSSHPANQLAAFTVSTVTIWLPVLAAIGQIGCYFVPGFVSQQLKQHHLASIPLDRRPTPSNMVPVEEATGTDIVPRAPGRVNNATLERLKERKKKQEEEEERRIHEARRNEHIGDNVKSWLE